ncbi:LysR substrate-binding domain-containing protein [Aestuariivirga sp.]|uniref:LysR substrate-binding domain-containing protein n=1 Tax=Aestuariivirga sp. TaxID=2650926 RepID=UPI0035936F7A
MQLPPLNALKSFESAARTGGYVTAATELGVTPAAVSQQVRHLEEFLGRKLFTRLNNRILLTDAGKAIFAGITPALEDIAALTTRVMSGSSRSKLVVSVIPSLAECWFMPALADYIALGAAIRIDLRVEDDPVDFASGEIDLRVCYGSTQYPEHHTVPLFRDHVVPLCAPVLAAQVSIASADDSQFIHTNWGKSFASHPSWGDWFGRFQPARRFDSTKGHRAGSSQLALDFARRGLGIALGQRALAQESISTGTLVVLQDDSLPLGHDYCAVHPMTRARRAGLAELNAFLQTRAPRP